MDTDDTLFDAENWKLEGNGVIHDIKKHVKHIELTDGTHSLIYFNLTTIEEMKFCVELSANGFRVVGNKYDEKTIDDGDYFETPYSLLNKISPMFSHSFGSELCRKLNALNN